VTSKIQYQTENFFYQWFDVVGEFTMRYNTWLKAAPKPELLNGSPVCKRSPIQVLTVLNVA
jgi:hypothetical protein